MGNAEATEDTNYGMKYLVCRILVLASVVAILGCASTRTVSPPLQSDSEAAQTNAKRSVAIVGYTTLDGAHVAFNGTVTHENELYAFTPDNNLRPSFSLPTHQVASIDVIESTLNERTAVLMLGTAAVLFGVYVSHFPF
jgi:hypothetical protein